MKPDGRPNAGIERPHAIWGDNPRLRNGVLFVVAALIVARVVTSIWIVEDHWRDAAEWLGYPVAPIPDPAKADARVRVGDIQRLFGDPANYPQEAMDRGEQGTAVAALNIAPSGVVTRCRIKQTSRSRALDKATCDLFSRVRADPARDGAGTAIASELSLRFRWQLPPE